MIEGLFLIHLMKMDHLKTGYVCMQLSPIIIIIIIQKTPSSTHCSLEYPFPIIINTPVISPIPLYDHMPTFMLHFVASLSDTIVSILLPSLDSPPAGFKLDV
jgi:hypothetical protein